MDVDRDNVIGNIRACLLSIKGGIPISSLNRDYRILVGTSIPFRELGHDSLESFLRSIPSMNITKQNGELILDAVPTKSTQHLAALVSKQKSAPRKLKAPRMAVWRSPAQQLRPSPRVSRPPQRFVSRPVTRSENMSVTVKQKSKQPAVRKVSFGEGYGDARGSNGFAIPPRFLRAPTQNSEQYHMNSQVPVQNHVVAPNVFATASRTPTPPLTPVIPEALTGPMAAMSLGVGNSRPGSLPTLPIPVAPSRSAYIEEPVYVEQPTFVEEPDYFEELVKLVAQSSNQEPSYKIVPRYPKGQPPVFAAVIKIGETNYNSFPEEHMKPDGALQIAAKRAFFELMKHSDGQQLPMTKEEDVMIERISKIVAAHPQGIWNTQIPVDYASEFKETLPADWLTILQRKRCPVLVESVGAVANNRAILTPCAVTSEAKVAPHSPTLYKPPQVIVITPAELVLPMQDTWDVYVTCAVSTTEVWVRLIGEEYSVQYEAMATDMEIYYMEKSEKVILPEIGSYYAIILDGCWHRVRLEEICSEEMGQIFFVDHGDEEPYRLDELFVLEPAFAGLPAQAVPICLSGLEEFSDDPNAGKHLLDLVVGKSLVAEVLSREPMVSAVLYDTSTEEDINVNQLFTERIFEDAHPPSLPENGEIKEVYLSHVSANGDVFLHFKGDSFKYLELLMEKLNANFSESELIRAGSHSCDPSKLYLAKYSVDNLWYRVGLIGRPNEENQIMVEFVDYGNREKTSASGVLVIERFSESLARLPAQAIRVRLHNVPPSLYGQKMADRLRAIVPEQEPVLVKVMKGSATSLPIEIEMFKRLEDNQLVSVNTTLALDSELGEKQKTDFRLTEPRSRRRIQSQRSQTSQDLDTIQSQGDEIKKLSVPAIPGVGSMYDVIVTMAANPSNFVVQPHKERKELKQLMEDMHNFYSTKLYEPVLPENVNEGSLFAARHVDNYWYRATVSNVIGGTMVSVYFCDFGDVAVLSLDQLAPLLPHFKQLPAQAIKAKLSRIVPRDHDWSVQDCIHFQDCVVDKSFVSIIVDCGPDLLNPSDIVLGLQLIDTSGPTDVSIDEMLVQEERAKFSSNCPQRNPIATYG